MLGSLRQAVTACIVVRSNSISISSLLYPRRYSSSYHAVSPITTTSSREQAPPITAARPSEPRIRASQRIASMQVSLPVAAPRASETETQLPLSTTSHEATRRQSERWSSRWDWRMTAPSRFGHTLHGRIAQPTEHKVRRIPASVGVLRGGERSAALKEDVIKYVETHSILLDLERKAQEVELTQRRETPTCKLVHAGLALEGLSGYYRTQRKHGRRVGVLQRPAARLFPYNNIKIGDSVELFPELEHKALNNDFGPTAFGEQDPEPFFFFDEEDLVHPTTTTTATAEATKIKQIQPLRPDPPITAKVVAISQHSLTLIFDTQQVFADLEKAKWTVIQGRNDVVYKRLIDTLRCMTYVLSAQEKALPPPLAPTATPKLLGELGITPTEIIFRGTELVDVLLGHASATGGGAFQGNLMLESWVKARMGKGNVVHAEGDPTLGLNRSQERAVAMMLGNKLSLVQGPPGTGKTHTIVAAVKLLKLHFQVPQPILLCAHTNVAVDNLALSAKRAGLKVVRAGDATRLTHEELRDSTLDDLMEAHPKKAVWEEMRSALVAQRLKCWELERDVRNRTAHDEETSSLDGLLVTPQQAYVNAAKAQGRITELKQSIAKLHANCFMLEQDMLSDILRDADVVCATAITSVSASLRAIDFPVVFFDEGSQATESITLVPLMKGAKHLALIGDHRQLPPVVASVEARKMGLALSLFERLIKRGDVPSTMLDVQHRMHPTLSAFPNAAFYAGALQNGASTSQIAPLKSAFVSPSLQQGVSIHGTPHERLAFLTHAHPEQRSDKSLRNPGEAELLGRILADVLVRNPALHGTEIGVVAPYAAQVKLLRRMLYDAQSPQRLALEAHLQHLGHRGRAVELSSIEVHTVDGFEGREKQAILFSSTRSNEEGYVGFLADARRMCVALTRAKSALWILGNLSTWEAAKLSDVGASAVEAHDTNVLREYAEWVEKMGLVVEASY